MLPQQQKSTLCPYTTLFRSRNKFAIGYIVVLNGVIGLLKIILGYTGVSFLKAGLFTGGIVLLIIGMYKQKTKPRSEEHTCELQSRPRLVCRLLLEKKKKKKN